MQGKTVRESAIIMAHQTMPEETNPYGNVHGGVIMKRIDEAAGVCSMRHSRRNSVTVSIDRVEFRYPVFVGELVTYKASVNMVGRTSMEVGVRVEAENLTTGKVRHTSSAYLTFVALGDDGRPAEVPPLILETDEDHRRNREALCRREMRLAEKKREAANQDRAEGQNQGPVCPTDAPCA
jgi:acyl-CoA hydrolase